MGFLEDFREQDSISTGFYLLKSYSNTDIEEVSISLKFDKTDCEVIDSLRVRVRVETVEKPYGPWVKLR